jgi:NAD(P)-dependent dehydrogenase (short-subunit alcohol dehydrogenase family)
MTTRQTALVTGASSGIGRSIALKLQSHGYDVVGTARQPNSASVGDIRLLPLDLADPASVRTLAAAVDRVDILVCNAGESLCGRLEDVPYDVLARLMRVNVLGHALLVQQLLPGMRRRGWGRIVMIGSMHASFPVAFRSGYIASKAALRGMADSLRTELAVAGVGVCTVEPGSIRTGIRDRRTVYLRDDSPDKESFTRFLEVLDAKEQEGIEPEAVARVVLRAVESGWPRRLYPVAPRAGVTYALGRILPARIVERLVARAHGLDATS